jgi:hypothetical protein
MTKRKDPKDLKKPGRPLSPKSTNVIVQQRVNEIFEMLIQGASRQVILQYANSERPADPARGILEKKSWGLTDRAIDNYIQKANEQFREASNLKADREIGRAITRYNAIYQKSMAAKNYQAALAAQKAIADLLGLNAPARLKIMNDDDGKPMEVNANVKINPEAAKALKDLYRSGALSPDK